MDGIVKLMVPLRDPAAKFPAGSEGVPGALSATGFSAMKIDVIDLPGKSARSVAAPVSGLMEYRLQNVGPLYPSSPLAIRMKSPLSGSKAPLQL